MSEIRYNELFDEYVLITPKRAKRPEKIPLPKPEVKVCPFCPGNIKKEEEIFTLNKLKPWATKVLVNLYEVASKNELKKEINCIFKSYSAYGNHEIIIDTPKHNVNLWDLSKKELIFWLETIDIRVNELKKDKNITFIRVFKNSGILSGATQPHPHTQIVALNLMPQNKVDLYKRSFNFFKKFGVSLFEYVFKNEKNIIYENEHFFAFSPFASVFSYESIIVSKDFSSKLKNLDSLADIISVVFKKYFSYLGEFDFNLYFEIAPVNENYQNKEFFEDIEKISTFFIRIIPRISRIGGFDLSSGMYINVVLPEMAAEVLKNVKIS